MQAATQPGDRLTGLSGAVSDVIAALGEFGVLALTFAETVFPPVPSEIVLPLAGYLAYRGPLDLTRVFLAATTGSVLGAWVLYWLGAKAGLERSSRRLAALPLVHRDDVDAAVAWFDRHGHWAVLLGRLVPGVRSLISLPAGTTAMNPWRFTIWTTVGSGLWNALLIGGGYALGTQYEKVEEYAGLIDRALIVGLALTLVLLIVNQLRRRRIRSAAGDPR
jgi:membrane protein DedA with SNARE-associated domain